MTREEYNELRYIKKSLKALKPSCGSLLTIRTGAGHEYKQKLHDFYTSLGFHPAGIGTAEFGYKNFYEDERIKYIKDPSGSSPWTELYTAEEKAAFAAALE